MRAALHHLRSVDPAMAALIGRVGACRLKAERGREPYEALVRAIAYQQLHGRAAESILARFLALYPGTAFPTPAMVLATAPAAQRLGVRLTSVCPGYVRTPMTAGNRYPMPGLMAADRAAAIILRGIAAGRRRVAFPWPLAMLARTAGLLPPRLVGALLGRAPGKAPIASAA
jgi:NAD(P)-dependent dehydrogenase (short-subunit alcohol dehydrogenase family)